MGRRRDNALLSVYSVIVVTVGLAWVALIGYGVLLLLRAILPEAPK